MLIHLNCNSIINYTFQIFNGEFESELYLSLADINMDGVMPCAADNFAGAVINSAFDISILSLFGSSGGVTTPVVVSQPSVAFDVTKIEPKASINTRAVHKSLFKVFFI